MSFYKVWVCSQRFHGKEPLTYGSDLDLAPGTIVTVPLQKENVVGIVDSTVRKPTFATKDVISVLVDDPLPLQSLQLFSWIQRYYPAPLGQITSLFIPSALTQKARNSQTDSAIVNQELPVLPVLKPEQEQAVRTIVETASNTFMLHGDTGTGKTRVYMELVRRTLDNNKSAIVLTPEIGLTPQLLAAFESTFKERVIVVHSHLTPAERRNVWLQILQNPEAQIVIGPRSALFSPVHTLGLIVIDESHDQAYKQEQAPYYQTSRVAAQLAILHKAKLILGSATPPVGDYYALSAKNLPILRMTEAAVETESSEVKVKLVDLKEKNSFTRSSWLSNELIAEIETALRNKEQSLVFLNRRGTARLVLCQECGWQALCPRCDLPLTYHADTHRMQCHTCGYGEGTPSSCPECRATDIIFRSIGTKSITAELEKLFPKAVVKRFDSDSNKDERFENHYEDVKAGGVDILVGTQMLTKGLDLPKLSVVGVVAADTSLYFPDYTAEERTYQMITQVMGRVGRGHRKGSIVVQTYHPESPVIAAAVNKDFNTFYQSQIKERQAFTFPPFAYLLKLTCARKNQASAQKASEKLATTLRAQKLAVEVIGPTPAFHEKLNNNYRWQIIVKSKERSNLTKIIEQLPANWTYDIDPAHLL
ncbi:MAG: hypothetical protein JWL85_341 [Candidatus Saccharibacteria bacterium]|nr:hypothetical protein [Candidatus Saccharibacteria bacterium]